MSTNDSNVTGNDDAPLDVDEELEYCRGCGSLAAPEDLDGWLCDGCLAEDADELGEEAGDDLPQVDGRPRGSVIA